MTGQCADAIEEILPAAEVIQRMVENGEEILRQFG
jgi:NAD(P)H-dependent flavin oxidoreductase YrpB (nitropropane dioxygenase family)